MVDIRISGPQVERSQAQTQEIEKSTFMGRVVSNLNSIKDKFETISDIFKAKVEDLKSFFSSRHDRSISAKPIDEEKIKGKGEEVLGTRAAIEPIGMERSFKNNPVYERQATDYQRFDSNNRAVKENYSRPNEPNEKYAEPSHLTNSIGQREGYTKPEKYADSSILRNNFADETYANPSQPGNSLERYSKPEKENSGQIADKLSDFASKIFNWIKKTSAAIEFNKADGQVRTYTFKKFLGEGSFKEVYQVDKLKVAINEFGQQIATASSRAVSIMNKSAKEQKSDMDIQAEIKVNAHLRAIYKEGKRDGVNNLPHVAIAKPITYEGETAFSSKLMAGGSLDKHVRELNDDQKRLVAQDMCKGLQELHHNGIMHRDVKLDNFLIDARMNVKIADMGKAFLTSDAAHNTGLFRPIIPPGAHATTWTNKDDIYQMGVALFQLFSGNDNVHGMRTMMAPDLSPEERTDIQKVYKARDEGISQWQGNDKIEPRVRDFIARMVDTDPNKRPDIDEVVNFFSQ